MKFSANSTLGQILTNEQAKAVLEKHLPGASTHPQVDMARGMSLREIASYPEAGLTTDKLSALDSELQQL